MDRLPNEILIGVLSHFTARDLLQLSLVNHRFSSLVCRIFHHRLIDIASLPANDLIFECFTPAAKLSTPYLDCRYVATKMRTVISDTGVGGGGGGGGNDDNDARFKDVKADEPPSLGALGRMYSVYHPIPATENRRTRSRFDGPSSLNEEDDDDVARELINLDSDQLFEQLCAITNVVKPGPRPGLFVSHVNISDGVLRLWRDWLAGMADDASNRADLNESSKILWVNAGQSVGLRMRVTHGPAERMPVLTGPDDLPPMTYRLEYQELFVRTADLLWAVEKSAIQEDSHTGKAIVIASM